MQGVTTAPEPAPVLCDPAMPMLAQALDSRYMAGRLAEILASPAGQPRLTGIAPRRHKPGRRSLIEYELVWPDGTTTSVLGKIRAKGLDGRSHAVQNALRGLGFTPDSPAGVAVPAVLGLAPELSMWLQEKVAGREVLPVLLGPGGEELAGRIAAAAHALHGAGLAADRRHGLTDELRVLDRQLAALSQVWPGWGPRLEQVLTACLHLAATSDPPVFRPSHRDFYHDNLLVSGACLYVLDLDLYCEADLGLDIGNFIAHLTEYSLRVVRDVRALDGAARVIEERFLRLAGPNCGSAVRLYETLTLVRHIAISSRMPERRWCAPELLALCERRLGIQP